MSTTASHTTPGRVSKLTLDPPYTSLAEFPFALVRVGTEIARAGFGPGNASNVIRYGNGGIGLRPIQMEPGKLEQTPAGAAAIMGVGDFDFPSPGIVGTKPLFRQQTELPGVTYDASVSSSGGAFLQKTIPAGTSWNQNNSADQTAFGYIPVTPANVPIDRFGVGRTTYAADTGYCWRFSVSATQKNAPQVIGSFYFGGAAADGGYGLFGLMLYGTGQSELWEAQNGTWTNVFAFRYASANRICGVVHQILIKPYISPEGYSAGYIDFFISDSGTTQPRGGLVQAYYSEPMLTEIQTYTINRKASGGTSPRPNVTGAGNVRHDIPRDQRPLQQFSKLVYPAAGWVVDFPFLVPFFLGNATNITLTWEASVPDGCTVLGQLRSWDGTTATPLAEVSSTSNSKTYTFPVGQSHFNVLFDFTSDGNNTPILMAYRVNKDKTINPAGTDDSVTVPVVTSVSVSGAEQDPSHETSSFTIEDLKAELNALEYRGRVAYRFKTAYDLANATKYSVLSDGFFIRSTGRRRGGKVKQGFGGGGADRLYPSLRWKQYMATGVGMWLRLNEKIALHLFDFSPASKFTDIAGQAPKVTDVARSLISYCGFSDDQIDVPDNPMRLMPREGQSAEATFCVMPGQQLGTIVIELLRDYLGWFLVWDGNAGAGKWRAIAPHVPPYTNLAVFKTQRPAGAAKLVNHAGAWGNTHSGYWSETGSVTGFIRRKTLETFTKPPEANAVLVIGGGGELPGKSGNAILAQFLINRDGLNYFPDYTATKVDNPDWISELLPLLVIDFTLGTQAAVDYFCWRIFHAACHGLKCARFEAPLLLITDATDASQTAPRPLRYYDPVQVNDNGTTSQWLVRNVNPGYRRDAHQLAMYELEAPRPPYV